MKIFIGILLIVANIWLYIRCIQNGDTLFAITAALGIVCGIMVIVLELLVRALRRHTNE